jgi:hypothetical protein
MDVADDEPSRYAALQRRVEFAAEVGVYAAEAFDDAGAIGVGLQAAEAPAGVAERAVVEVHRVLCREHDADAEGALVS